MSFERLSHYFMAHPVAANLLMVLMILSGVYSLLTIEQEVFPDFNPPAIIIEADVVGATALNIEKSLILAIERELKGEPGINRIETYGQTGKLKVLLELHPKASVDTLLAVVKSKIDSISTFPANTENLRVYPRDDRHQLLWVHLHGEQSLASLRPMADIIQAELLQLPSVSQVKIQGLAALELRIEINNHTLQQQGLRAVDIAKQIKASNIDVDIGSLMGDGQQGHPQTKLIVRQQHTQIETLRQLPIYFGETGQSAPLHELATLSYQSEEPGTVSRLNGNNAVGFALYRNDDVTPLTAIQEVNNYLKLSRDRLPAGMHLVAWLDESRELGSRITLLSNNGLLGLGLVLLVLILFTQWRIAFWVAVGIPVTYLATLWGMTLPGIDLSLNVISLFGFLIVSGILVDDALVVGESIYTELDKLPANSPSAKVLSACQLGLGKVAIPATFGVLTTIAAFYPLTQLEGDMGHAIGAVSVVIMICLTLSIVESKLILPAHLYHAYTRHGYTSSGTKQTSFAQRQFDRWQQRYLSSLRKVLHRPQWVLNCAVGGLIVSISLISSGWIKTVMLPEIADFEVEGELVTPVNASLSQQNKIALQIERALITANNELSNKYQMDYSPLAHHYTFSQAPNRISILAELEPDNANPVLMPELVQRWRSHIPRLPQGYSFSLSASADPDEGINVQLEGADYAVLLEAVTELKQVLASFPGVSDIRDNFSAAQNEYVIELTDEALALGVTVEFLAQAIHHAVFGIEVQRLQMQHHEVKVMLRYPIDERRSPEDLAQILVNIGEDRQVPLSQLARLEFQTGIATIQRVNGHRAINVFANNDDSIAGAELIMDSLEDGYLETLVERYPSLTYRIEGEARESDSLSYSLLVASVTALFVVYALLALPLQSFTLPFWVMSVIPFSIIGVVAAHVLFALPLSLTSLFGAIALIGVLVNDSLVLIYRFEQNRKGSGNDGDITQALLDACTSRFRPIVITSITTFCGMMPIIFETDPEALWLVPIAISLGCGVLFGTLITLFLLPSILLLVNASLPQIKTATLAAATNDEQTAR